MSFSKVNIIYSLNVMKCFTALPVSILSCHKIYESTHDSYITMRAIPKFSLTTPVHVYLILKIKFYISKTI